MNKAQAIFLAELAKMAFINSELMKEFNIKFGTYGEELATEGLDILKDSFKLVE